MILLGSLHAIDGTRIPMDDQEEKENVIQYIIIINIIHLADQGVPEYFHKPFDKYRKQASDVLLINMKGRAYNLDLDVLGLLW